MTSDTSRRLAAVWFAEVVGYAELSATDEDLALQVIRELQRLARLHCDGRGGRVVKVRGDAVVTVFDSADGAVQAATGLRDAFLSTPRVEAAGVSIRVGLHLGDVTEEADGDIYGDAVNAASRIQDVAKPGQVVISSVAYQLLQHRATLLVEDLGEHDVTGLGPVTLYAASRSAEAETFDLRALLQEELAPLQVFDLAARGGMGEIYLVRDPRLRRTLAVKVLRSELVADRHARTRFLREAQIIAGLSHPNVIAVHAVGELKDGTPYFVMDYVDGGSLRDRIEAEGSLSVPEVRRILGGIASGLAAAHERGVVHRDIKPSNVLCHGDSGRVLITDWGIAALDPAVEMSPEARLTRTGAVIGSPMYMSPEQLSGDQVSYESDIYSLGLLAFELLTGEGPFAAQTPRALMVAHLKEEAPDIAGLREDVDPALGDLVARCLHKNPSERPRAHELVGFLSPGGRIGVEWPPPGLDPLHGIGAGLSESARRCAWSVAGFLGLVWLQPSAVTGLWAEGEQSPFWRSFWGPVRVLDEIFIRPTNCAMSRSMTGEDGACITPIDASPVWLLGLTILLALVVMYAWRGGEYTMGLWRGVRRARRSGYPHQVGLQVAWDQGPDTGDLIAGRGHFAYLDEAARRRLLDRRYLADVAELALLMLAGAMPVLFLLGMLPALGTADRFLTTAELAFMVTPVVASVVLRHFFLAEERRYRQRFLREANPLKWNENRPWVKVIQWARRPLPQPHLARAWLENGGAEAPHRNEPRRRAVLVTGALALSLVSLAGATFLYVAAMFFSLWISSSTREMGLDWLQFVENQANAPLQWAALDTALYEIAAPLAVSGGDVPALVDTLMGPLVWPGQSYSTGAVSGPEVFQRLAGAVAGRPPGIDGAVVPWLNTSLNRGGVVPQQLYRFLGQHGDYLLARDDSAAVRAMGRQAIAVGRYISAGPGRSLRDGIHTTVLGLDLLARALPPDQARPYRLLAAAVEQNRWAHRNMLGGGFDEVLMASPTAPPAAKHVGNRALAPGVRLALARGLLTGLCYNGREMLLGVSPDRIRVFEQSIQDVEEIEGSRRMLETFRAAAGEALGAGGGIRGLSKRWDWCAAYLVAT